MTLKISPLPKTVEIYKGTQRRCSNGCFAHFTLSSSCNHFPGILETTLLSVIPDTPFRVEALLFAGYVAYLVLGAFLDYRARCARRSEEFRGRCERVGDEWEEEVEVGEGDGFRIRRRR